MHSAEGCVNKAAHPLSLKLSIPQYVYRVKLVILFAQAELPSWLARLVQPVAVLQFDYLLVLYLAAVASLR